jgi:hypothetical protein
MAGWRLLWKEIIREGKNMGGGWFGLLERKNREGNNYFFGLIIYNHLCQKKNYI